MQSIIALYVICGAYYVTGYGIFRNEIPNGNKVSHPCKPNTLWRGVGHLNEAGGGPRNPFGLDFYNNNKTWTQELCMKDSDGDGQTNGQELGDPNCVWVKGSLASRTNNITHPGVCTPFYSSHCQGKNDWVECTKADFVCPALSSPDTQNFTLRFPRTKVPARETTYKCAIFDLPSDQDYHMVASKSDIDNENVMHHIVLYGCDDYQGDIPSGPYDCNMGAGYNCITTIAIWTNGIAGNCLNENFGMLFGKSKYKKFALEFHWNNPTFASDLYDSSGMTIFYTKNLRKHNGAVLTLGQMYLMIPPGKPATTFTATCSGDCTSGAMSAPIYIASALNHMHYLGSSQSVEQWRNGTRLRYITNEENYDYDNPHPFNFDQPLEVLPNDEFITTCTYDSRSSTKTVYYGNATSDEMCFAFLWYYPAEALPDTNCLSYKSVPICAARMTTLSFDGCNINEFMAPTNPLFAEIGRHCYGQDYCTEPCKLAAMEYKDHPCNRGGKTTEYINTIMNFSSEGVEFMRRVNMCDIKKEDYLFPSASGTRSGVTMLLIVVAALFCVM